MPLYEIGTDRMTAIEATTFSAANVNERQDLQRWLREQIEIVVPDGMVLAEEFSNWDDSRRRVDLLVLDRDANLVVVELKRTDDGGHMELQAIRYAAMISAMTFHQAVDAHGQFLVKLGIEEDPQARILEFLGWDDAREDAFAQEVRIVLASADFSKELTTAVLWMNERDIDIRCVRMKPYKPQSKRSLKAHARKSTRNAPVYAVEVWCQPNNTSTTKRHFEGTRDYAEDSPEASAETNIDSGTSNGRISPSPCSRPATSNMTWPTRVGPLPAGESGRTTIPSDREGEATAQ